MIEKDAKMPRGTCWSICSGIFVQNPPMGDWTYMAHRRDSWTIPTVGNETTRLDISMEDKKRFLSSIDISNHIISLQFKIYAQAKGLSWSNFAGGLLQSINGGYVRLNTNRCIKIIEEGTGIWKAHMNPPQTRYVLIAPPYANGRLIEHSFPYGYAVSGFSFIENPGVEGITEISIKDVGAAGNLPYNDRFCLKVCFTGAEAWALLQAYLAGKLDIVLHAASILEASVQFNRCLAVIPYNYRDKISELKREWDHALTIFKSPKIKINLDTPSPISEIE